MQIFQLLLIRRLDEAVLYHLLVVNREGIVIEWKLLERRTIGVPVQLEPVVLPVLLEVVSVLILRHEDVVGVAAGFEGEELLGDVVEDLVFVAELLEFLVEFVELERVDFVLDSFGLLGTTLFNPLFLV